MLKHYRFAFWFQQFPQTSNSQGWTIAIFISNFHAIAISFLLLNRKAGVSSNPSAEPQPSSGWSTKTASEYWWAHPLCLLAFGWRSTAQKVQHSGLLQLYSITALQPRCVCGYLLTRSGRYIGCSLTDTTLAQLLHFSLLIKCVQVLWTLYVKWRWCSDKKPITNMHHQTIGLYLIIRSVIAGHYTSNKCMGWYYYIL